MKWGSVSLYLGAAIWFVAVILWPMPSNVQSPKDARQSSGEGLYKASLTQANFGLLGVQFFETNKGKKRWNINSKFAELHRKENYAFMQDVDSQFFAENTGNVVTTKSDYGRSLTEKHLVELEGNVSIKSKRGYLFSMEKLTYNGNTHGFTSEDRVQMRGPVVEKPSMFLRGTGLAADIDREHFILKKNVTAQKRLKSNEWLKISSRAGEFFTDDSRAVFVGKVHSALPSTSIDSDIFEMSVTKDQEFLIARGNVVLKNKDRVGYAETAMVELGTSKIVLEGKARIDAKGNQVTGKRIILYTDDDRIEVEDAEGRVSQ